MLSRIYRKIVIVTYFIISPKEPSFTCTNSSEPSYYERLTFILCYTSRVPPAIEHVCTIFRMRGKYHKKGKCFAVLVLHYFRRLLVLRCSANTDGSSSIVASSPFNSFCLALCSAITSSCLAIIVAWCAIHC